MGVQCITTDDINGLARGRSVVRSLACWLGLPLPANRHLPLGGVLFYLCTFVYNEQIYEKDRESTTSRSSQVVHKPIILTLLAPSLSPNPQGESLPLFSLLLCSFGLCSSTLNSPRRAEEAAVGKYIKIKLYKPGVCG